MKIIKNLTIDKPIADVWDVLANKFGEIDLWSSLITDSKLSGEATLETVDYSIRSTQTTAGPTQQQLTEFDPQNFTIAYKAISGTPPFFKSVNAKWILNKKDENSTYLTLDFEVKFKNITFILAPLVKIKLGKVGDVLLDDLKYYVENEKPHPRKLKLLSVV